MDFGALLADHDGVQAFRAFLEKNKDDQTGFKLMTMWLIYEGRVFGEILIISIWFLHFKFSFRHCQTNQWAPKGPGSLHWSYFSNWKENDRHLLCRWLQHGVWLGADPVSLFEPGEVEDEISRGQPQTSVWIESKGDTSSAWASALSRFYWLWKLSTWVSTLNRRAQGKAFYLFHCKTSK